MSDSGAPDGGGVGKVRVDGEDAVLHITDQSVMFEKGGRVSGFERSAIRMVKPDGDAMIIAYSVGSEVKSVRIEPMTAVTSLVVSGAVQTQSQSPPEMDEVFERLYRDTRKKLEERLDRINKEPENKALRLSQDEFLQQYSQIFHQMERILDMKYGPNPHSGSQKWSSIHGIDSEPADKQLKVVKVCHIDYLNHLASQAAEWSDGGFAIDDVWPEEWDKLLRHFGLADGPLPTERWKDYLAYLGPKWTHRPKGNRTDPWILALS